MTTQLRRALSCAFAAAALAGCRADAPAPGTAGDGGTHATVGGGPAGGVLIYLADREPDHLNPLTYSSHPAFHAVYLMFRSLARRDSTMSTYAPDLARAWRFENDSTLILELRDDVRWHDGVPVTAEDVVFTIEMQRDPATASPRQSDVEAVSAVAARDAHTVEVRLRRNSLYTVNALLEVVPVPRHLLEGVAPADMRLAPFGRNPVGNNWYRFGRWTPNQQLVLEVDPDRAGGRAGLDRIVMRFIPDVSAGLSELLTAQGDLIRLPADQVQRVEQARGVDVHHAKRVRPAWIAWNTRRPPLDDVRVRRALLMAIDRHEIARWLFGETGEPALSPIPAALREHSPGVRPVPFDPDGARRLLEEAGWRDTNGDGLLDRGGRPLRIEVDYISTDATRRDVLVAMQRMLRRVGVDLAPRAVESNTWVQRLREGSFTASFWGWGWGPGVVGPNAAMVFHSRSIPPGGPNFAAARHPRIDALLDTVLAATDTAQARAHWAELEQLMIEDAVYAPIYMDPELFAVNARFRNVRFRGSEWVEDVPWWYVDPEQRLPRDRSR
jgi:peptide/nickel transport system substrate-binding protein